MSTPHQQPLVEAIKADLVARGVIPDPQTTNDHALAITARVAWATRDQGALLIRKGSGQNGAWLTIRGARVKVSHDALNYPDGNVDLLIGGGPPSNRNTPAWQWTPGSHGPTDADAVAPIDLEAGVVGIPPVVVPPVDPPPPSTDLVAAVEALAHTVDGLRRDLAALHAVLDLDVQALGAALTRIEAQQQKGLSGSVFGARIRLVP